MASNAEVEVLVPDFRALAYVVFESVREVGWCCVWEVVDLVDDCVLEWDLVTTQPRQFAVWFSPQLLHILTEVSYLFFVQFAVLCGSLQTTQIDLRVQ